eukprot:TRINITY_DN3067_c0_g2_i1.p2 TRINITY_DN3067_c0_g2~~TRINITY_DN3067_c0_g2_i1.p2  ORF type:complete len:374 (-),score=73.71 TRINITY_DN3067_c0_g2_i1:1749-2870(-)
MELEHALLKAPYEATNKVFRDSHRSIEKEFQNATKIITSLKSKGGANAIKQVDGLLKRLQHLKRKLTDGHGEEEALMERCRTRLRHLKQQETEPDDPTWQTERLERALVDYLLRENLTSIAADLAAGPAEGLMDLDIFQSSAKIVDALRAHDCTPALAWCNDHKSRLKALSSSLEFHLRIQEFVELRRLNKVRECVEYARKNLQPWAATHLKDIQKLMALLAFRDTALPEYQSYLQAERWEKLVDEFKHESYRIHSLTSQPMLLLTLQAGLAALKTPFCDDVHSRNANCPVCNETVNGLAKSLPIAHHTQSALVCRISGEPINEDNPPMVLPNGNVYGKKALEAMSELSGGTVTCPRSGDSFPWDQLRKAYIS